MLERLLWNWFNYAESYTFFLVWVVIPLTFLAAFLWLRGASSPVAVTAPMKQEVAPPASIKPAEIEPVAGEPKVNLNEANA